MAAASANRSGRRRAWLLAGVLVAALCAARAALASADTIAVTISGPGLPLQLRVAGTAGEAAGMVWVALTPGAAPSCPADPTQSSHIVFRGPVFGPGAYGAVSTPPAIEQGGYTLCAWLTRAADPASVLATEGPKTVEVSPAGGGSSSGGGSGSAGGSGSGGGGATGATGSTPRSPRITSFAAAPLARDAVRFSMTLTGSATIVLTLERVSGTRARRVLTALGSVHVLGRRGRNRFTVSRWAGRIPRSGSYEVLARTESGGRRSAASTASVHLP